MKHAAFISYSHAADGKLAPALQQGLEQLAKPWHRRRALAVFRDVTNLSASPQLWQSIEDELAQSDWFLLLASPESARSKWVTREVQWWLKHRDPNRLLILLTGGELAWDENASVPDVDWARSNALPPVLKGVFAAEPHYIDMRSLQHETSLTLEHIAFRAAVLTIAAPLHGRSPDEMDGEAVRVHARNRRLAGAAVASLVVLTGLALWQTHAATQARDIALSRQLAAQSTALLDRSTDTAMLLAVQAWRTRPTAEARSALLRGLQLGPILRFLPSHASPIVGVAIDRNAQWVVAASTAGDVTRVRIDGAEPDWSYRSDQPIERMALSPDGTVLAIGRRDGQVQVLVPGRAAPLHVLRVLNPQRITALAFSPDGTRLASGDADGGIALWETTSGAQLGGVAGRFNSSPTEALAFGDDTATLYAAIGLSIGVWDSATWQRRGELGGVKDSMVVDALVPVRGTGALTAVVWQDNAMRMLRWDTTAPGAAPQVIASKVSGISRLAYSADGSVRALAARSGDVVFQVAGTEASHKAHNGEVRGIAIRDDGRHIVSGGDDGRLIVWDRNAAPPHSGKLGAASAGLAALAASPDGRFLVSGNAAGQLLWLSSGADAPRLRVGPPLQPLGEPRSRARGVTAVAYAPDGNRVAAGLADGSIVLQPVDGSVPAPRVRDWGAGYPVVALAYAPDGDTLVSAHYDGSVVLRSAATGAPRGEPVNIVNDSGDAIRGLSFSGDSQRLLVHAQRRGVLVRKVAQLATASRATLDSALAFSAGAASAVVFSQVLRSSADGRWAWASTDGQVQLRSSDDGAADGTPLVVTGGLNIRSLAFSPDRVTLAVAGSDTRILLWDLRERRPVDEPLRGANAGGGMAFTEDGRFLVTRSGDAELGWWSTDGDTWARLLCGVVNRRFSVREWANYMGSVGSDNAACGRVSP